MLLPGRGMAEGVAKMAVSLRALMYIDIEPPGVELYWLLTEGSVPWARTRVQQGGNAPSVLPSKVSVMGSCMFPQVVRKL